MTVDDKPYLFNREKLAQPIHMELSQKQKLFLNIFFAFSKPVLNFKYFPKKGEPHPWCVSGYTGSEKYGWINV